MEPQELRAAFDKAKAALDDLGRIIDRQLGPPPTQRSKLSRRALCEAILKKRPGLSIYEIVDEMRKQGYPFRGQNPLDSVRSMLYKRSEFACSNGRFWLKHAQEGPTPAKAGPTQM